MCTTPFAPPFVRNGRVRERWGCAERRARAACKPSRGTPRKHEGVGSPPLHKRCSGGVGKVGGTRDRGRAPLSVSQSRTNQRDATGAARTGRPPPFAPPSPSRTRRRHAGSGLHIIPEAARRPPLLPRFARKGDTQARGRAGKGTPPHPLRPAPICTQRGCAQTRPPGSCRDGKRAGGARLTRGSAPSPPHCTQGNRGGVNLEEPPRGVRAGATCEREAAQTQEQPPPPLCMRQGGKRTGGRAQTQRRYPSCLFTRKGNGRARKRGHAGHAHSACPLSIDLDKKSP